MCRSTALNHRTSGVVCVCVLTIVPSRVVPTTSSFFLTSSTFFYVNDLWFWGLLMTFMRLACEFALSNVAASTFILNFCCDASYFVGCAHGHWASAL